MVDTYSGINRRTDSQSASFFSLGEPPEQPSHYDDFVAYERRRPLQEPPHEGIQLHAAVVDGVERTGGVKEV